MKKKIFLSTVTLAFLLLGGSTFIHTSTAEAHGYVKSPASRAYQGMLDKQTLDWSSAHAKYGNVINEPQSLEGEKGFPERGPSDGRLASVNGVLGDYILDQAGANRWKKQAITTGSNNFTWHYTANHSTTKWHYYMTKPGWNPEKELSRDSLELIGEISHDGSSSENNQTHQINIPNNRSGYHIIYAVWDIADTANAFYQIIDVDVNGSGSESGNSNGNGSDSESGNSNGNGSGSESGNSNGNSSGSESGANTNKPSTPSELHSMETTTNSVTLMWSESTHASGISHYEIYRDGKKVHTSETTSIKDTNLTPNTAYTYSVKAVSTDGKVSDFSTEFKVTTKKENQSEGNTPPEQTPNDGTKTWKLGSHSNPVPYTAGERVQHNGKTYLVRQTHSNYGDFNWAPHIALSLFIEE